MGGWVCAQGFQRLGQENRDGGDIGSWGHVVLYYMSIIRHKTRVVHLVYMIQNDETEIEITRESGTVC